MKYLIPIALSLVLISCGPEAVTEENQGSPIVSSFLSDVSSLEDEESKTPITKFQNVAGEEADKTMALKKGNIEDILEEAKNYKYLVITVGDHTIVRIDDVTKCNDSGSWGACMPYGEGYVKKGALQSKEDYINNIIGVPDGQKRTAYLFK